MISTNMAYKRLKGQNKPLRVRVIHVTILKFFHKSEVEGIKIIRLTMYQKGVQYICMAILLQI